MKAFWVAMLGFSAQCMGQANNSLPIVDLGYELPQALSYNATTDVYKFANIRYAQAPVGDLRFRAPLEPLANRATVQNGTGVRVCPQAVPDWLNRALTPLAVYSSGRKNFSLQAFEADVAASALLPVNFTAGNSEDCLFLDVYMPGKALGKCAPSAAKAPVLVWIHGGGFVLGSKTGTSGQSTPSGLLAQAAAQGEPLVFVALNYRLAALGFLAGPGVDSNAGLLDQRLALRWVQKHIHLFGGDAGRVTVMGESAGGSSVLLHMAAGKAGAAGGLFKQAIVQSPAVMPTLAEPAAAAHDFLALLNVSSADAARRLPTDAVIRANAAATKGAPPATFVYGPVVDGALVPGALLSMTRFDASVKVLAAHNAFEGGLFFDPAVKTEADFAAWVRATIVAVSDKAREYLVTTLYPPVFDGSRGYVDQASRQMALFGESVIDCNFLLANQAFGGRTYAYQFSVTPGLHIQDVSYTLNDPTSLPASIQAQETLQHAIVSFTLGGVPTFAAGGKQQAFPAWGSRGSLVNISLAGSTVSKSSVNQTRCHWWNQGQF